MGQVGTAHQVTGAAGLNPEQITREAQSIALKPPHVSERMSEARRQVQPMFWFPDCQLVHGTNSRHLCGKQVSSEALCA